MSKTADVLQAIWTDPWFLDLPTDAKCLYLWAITTDHGNQAGLFVIGRRVIEFETGMTAKRLDAALAETSGKLAYDEATGALWVVGKAKRVRAKTEQIAKSIRKAVVDCPLPTLAGEFVNKYGDHPWLKDHLADLPRSRQDSEILRTSPEPQPTSCEVAGLGQGLKEEQHGPSRPRAKVARFNGKPVPPVRQALAEHVLADFNAQVGTSFGAWTADSHASDSLTRIIGALTRWPDELTADYCHRLIAATLREQWWDGPATVGVVFGPKVIERNMARLAAAGPRRTSVVASLTGAAR